MDHRIERPTLAVRRGAFGAHGDRSSQAQSAEYRVQDVASHVAEGGGAEIDPLAPIHRMIDIEDEGTRLRHTDPVIPVECGGDGVGALGQRIGIAPLLFAERMHFLDLADGAALDQLDGGLVLAGGMNLDAHLGDQVLLLRHGGEHVDFVDAVRHGLLLVDRKPEAHGGHRHGRVHVVWRAHAYRVEVVVLLGEHLPPVLVHARFGRALLLLLQLRRIHFGDTDQFHLGMAQEHVEGDVRHAARAECAEAELIAGRRRDQIAHEERRR